MMTDGLSIADAMALAKGNEDDVMGGWGSTWIWVFFLFFLLAWGGDGFGFGGNRGAGTIADMAATNVNGMVTRADLFNGFNNQDLQRQIQDLGNGLSSLGYAQQAANYDNTITTLQGLNGVQGAIAQTGYETNLGISTLGYQTQAAIAQNGYQTQTAINQAGYQNQLGQLGINQQLMQNRYDNQLGLNGVTDVITQNRFAAQMESCATNRNIDSVKYENASNTSEIVRAIQDEAAATRALINQNAMQELRDKLEDRDRQLMVAQLQTSQVSQTSSIIDALNPTPRPAYITCSPYESTYMAQKACGCGCGCGC